MLITGNPDGTLNGYDGLVHQLILHHCDNQLLPATLGGVLDLCIWAHRSVTRIEPGEQAEWRLLGLEGIDNAARKYLNLSYASKKSARKAYTIGKLTYIVNLEEGLRYLAEAVWMPSALLPSNGVAWEAVDDLHARASLTYQDITDDELLARFVI